MKVMLHLSAFSFAPAGTRPWMPGSGLEPGPQRTCGVATKGGSEFRWIGTRSGLSPLPCRSESRSLSGPGSAPVALRGGSTSAPTTRTIRTTRAARTTGESYSAVDADGCSCRVAPRVLDRDRRPRSRRELRARPEAAVRVRLEALPAAANDD